MLNSNANAYSYDIQPSAQSLPRSVARVSPIDQLYTPQTNGEISDSIMQNWTQQALECYEINCECARCSLSDGNYSFICQMPKIVKALLKAYGEPQNRSR